VVLYGDDEALEAGDIIWVDFGPPMGHEQSGRRPALVISARSYNERSSLILVCPITRNVAPWAFKVEIQAPSRINGSVLVDQMRSIDRYMRFVRRADRVGSETLRQVHGLIVSLIAIPVSN
jgi:mRNA interferase MazF